MKPIVTNIRKRLKAAKGEPYEGWDKDMALLIDIVEDMDEAAEKLVADRNKYRDQAEKGGHK